MEEVMHCSRCQGLMLKEHLLDLEGGFGEMWTQSWRCTNCGAIHDAVIEQNRLALKANGSVLTSDPPTMQRENAEKAFVRSAA
jgi:hypothetical protein